MKIKRRDPRYDPQEGDVIKDPEGYYIYVRIRTPRMVFIEPFGKESPMLWCSQNKLWSYRKNAKECEVVITV